MYLIKGTARFYRVLGKGVWVGLGPGMRKDRDNRLSLAECRGPAGCDGARHGHPEAHTYFHQGDLIISVEVIAISWL